MITRYLKPIELSPVPSSDAKVTFINMIASEFVSVGFTEVTPITSFTPAKSVRFENLQIDIYEPNNSLNKISFKPYLYYDEENYYAFTSFPEFIIKDSTYNCNLCFFMSNDRKFVSINIAQSSLTQIGKGTGNLLYVVTDNEEIVGSINTSSSVYYSTNQYNVTSSLKRTYPKEENVFFLDEGVPILKSSDSSYVMDMPYLTTLGGAEKSHTYTMTNGDNYYCLTDNIAVKFDTTAFSQTAGG